MPADAPRAVAHHRLRRSPPAALVTALLTATFVAVAPPAAADPAETFGRYHPATPQRVLDTRAGSGVPLGPGQTRVVDFGSAITTEVDAVVLNVTAVNATADGYLTLHPESSDRPLASSVRHRPGEAGSTSVTVGVSNHPDGRRLVKVFNSSGSTDLVVDLFGWYLGEAVTTTTPSPSSYYPLPTPTRLFDSRGAGGPLVDGQSRVLNGTARIGSTEYLEITAVAVTLTVVTPGGNGYLQAWDGSGAAPTVSSVNFVKGRTVANSAVVPVVCHNPLECSDYSFALRNRSAGTNVVVDVVGFYALPDQVGATVYRSFPPYRVVDTRTATPFGQLGPGATGVAPIGDSAGTSAVAANLTVTAVTPSASTYLTVYPDTGTRPVASTVNAAAGQVVVNATQTRVVGQFGRFRTYNNSGSTQVVVDVNGAFFPE